MPDDKHFNRPSYMAWFPRSAGPIAVMIEVTGSADLQAAGLTKAAVQRAVEQRLRQGKITIDEG